MRPGPLAIVALVTCGAAWLLVASFLTLHLLGRLPDGRARNARAFRRKQAAGLALMTTILLFQVGGLAHWASPVSVVLDLLVVLAGADTVAVVIKAATISSQAKRTKAAFPPPGDCSTGPMRLEEPDARLANWLRAKITAAGVDRQPFFYPNPMIRSA